MTEIIATFANTEKHIEARVGKFERKGRMVYSVALFDLEVGEYVPGARWFPTEVEAIAYAETV